MKLAIEHSTTCQYEHRVNASTQLLRLTPRRSARQKVLSWDLDLPCPATRDTDPYGNVQHVLTLDRPHQAVVLTARGVVELDAGADDAADGINPLVFLPQTALTRADAALADFADNFRSDRPTRDHLRALAIAVADHVAWVPLATPPGDAASAWDRRSGSCHELAHLFIASARLLGVPARFVSGYVHSPARNHVASHAWCEAFLDGRWLTFDVANRLDRPTTHLRLAVGRDWLEACPVRGVRAGNGAERLQASIEMAQQPNQ